MKSLLALNPLFWRYKHLLALGVVFIVTSNLFGIYPAMLVRSAMDYVVANYQTYKLLEGQPKQAELYGTIAQGVFYFGLGIVAMALLRGLFLFLMRQTIIVMSRLIEYDQKNQIYQHYQRLPLAFYRRNKTGDLMARISEDVSRVRMYTGPALMYGINLVSIFVMVIGQMISVNPTLTLYTVLPLPILSISIYYVNNIINKRSEEIQKSLSRLSNQAQEAFSGIRVLKAFAKENDYAQIFQKEVAEYHDKSLRLANTNALFFPLMNLLIGASTITTVIAGGFMAIDGSITAGNIAEFVIYVNMLTWPVTSLGWVTSMTQRSAASQARINEFLAEDTDIVSKERLTSDVKGDLSFEHVSFTYPDSGITALRDVSFHVKAGSSLAIMGTTGSGKTTIAQLISRMYDPSLGKILLDGKPLPAFEVHYLRQQVAQVPQDVFLFSDTIFNNIGFGFTEAEAPMEAVSTASDAAGLTEAITSFPDGLQTKIGERGITLSGGQKQRVSLARALVLNPKILILDDALSAVDTKTENAILQTLSQNMAGKTTIIISHRVSSARLADYIIFLDNGQIVEQGTHIELMANGGAYKDLYEKQVNSEESLTA